MTLSQRAEYNALRERYLNDLKPHGTEQETAAALVINAAWALRVLERNEAEMFRSYSLHSRDEKARRTRRGLSAVRSHYAKVYQSATRLFMQLASLDAKRKRARATSPQRDPER